MRIRRPHSRFAAPPGPAVRRLAALALVALIAAVVAAALIAHGGRGGGMRVLVESERSGLALEPGAMVKMHGVQIGTVTAVHTTALDTASGAGAAGDAGTTVEVSVDRSADPIPADVHAAIRSTTVFGAKYVTLLGPAGAQAAPAGERLSDGDRIPADNVTVEVESLFESLTRLTREASPDKLDAVLTAVADGVEHRGRQLGETLDNAAGFLDVLAVRRQTLDRDIAAAADTSATYDQAAPHILDTLDHAATTSRTVSARDALLATLLPDVTAASDNAGALLSDNADALADDAAALVPTTALFDRYAPGIPCFFRGANTTRKASEPVSGGNGATMILRSTLLFGLDPYDPAEDLPQVRGTGGPRCGGLPKLTMADVPAPYVAADTGANPVGTRPETPRILPDKILWLLTGGTGGTDGTTEEAPR